MQLVTIRLQIMLKALKPAMFKRKVHPKGENSVLP